MIDDADYQKQVRKVVEEIRPILAGRELSVQGGALCDLLSIWIAECNPDVRDDLLARVVETVEKLIPIQEQLLFGPGGHPGADDSKSMQ